MKSRIVAILLAFFFGAIGIHKFYLGQNFTGILYLLFSWTFIPAIIAFFEFLGLALMSDQAFNAKFNGGRMSSSVFPASSKDVTATLGELKKLFDSGVITAEEYEQKRRKLLDLL